jgi:glycosyltransferase involved in cell wall biosynthesis
MSLIVNKLAVSRSSRGVSRFFFSIINHLNWDSEIKYVETKNYKALDRIFDLLRNGSKKDIFWTPCLRGPFNIPNHIITVHDCINVEYIHKNDWRLYLFKKITQKIIDNSVKIVAISETTKKSFLENYSVEENKIVVIKSFLNLDWIEHERSLQEGLKTSLSLPYILMVTNKLFHKNNFRAFKALIQSSCDKFGVSLRVVGDIGIEEYKLLHSSRLKFFIENQVTDSRLFELYSNALFLLSPSLSEGHNLSIGEAIESGSNVLCSDIPAHREFYDGMVKFFNPYDIEDMTEAINASIRKEGSWYQVIYNPKKNLLDAANNYRQLFLDVEYRHCRYLDRDH